MSGEFLLNEAVAHRLKTLQLDEWACSNLRWWITTAGCPIPMHRDPPLVTNSSDAFNVGWGAAVHTAHAGGPWHESEAAHHINWKKLIAVWLGLKSLLRNASNQTIRLEIDNTTTVAYLNRQGGTHSLRLCTLAIHVLEWAAALYLELEAVHVPGALNNTADYNYVPSRGGDGRLDAPVRCVCNHPADIRTAECRSVWGPPQCSTAPLPELASRSRGRSSGSLLHPFGAMGECLCLSAIQPDHPVSSLHPATRHSTGTRGGSSLAVTCLLPSAAPNVLQRSATTSVVKRSGPTGTSPSTGTTPTADRMEYLREAASPRGLSQAKD